MVLNSWKMPPNALNSHVWGGLKKKLRLPWDGTPPTLCRGLLDLTPLVKIINANCAHPIKYLRYLAWCIFSRHVNQIQSREVYVAQLEQGAGMQFSPYISKKQLKSCTSDWYSSVVALAAMKHHSDIQTETHRREKFRRKSFPGIKAAYSLKMMKLGPFILFPLPRGMQ
jgi:hypothetical protein